MEKKVWIQRFLNKWFSKQVVKKIDMLENNKTSFTLTKNPKSRNPMKYINIIYHHIGRLENNRELDIK